MKPAFAPHKISRAQLKAIKKDIIVTDMEFAERITKTGLILPSDNGTSLGIRPRWGQVYAIGHQQQDVTVGQWVCIAHGRWTRGLDIEDESGKKTIRKIDPNDILLVSDVRPQDDTMSDAVHIQKQTR
jgi:co-chaperonin GroES (HSP10)